MGPPALYTPNRRAPDGSAGDADGALVLGRIPGVRQARDLDDGARVRRVDELAAADVDADVADVGLEEHEVAGLEVAVRHVRTGVPLRPRVVVKGDAELGVHPHREPRAVKSGRAGAAPHVGDA